MACLAAGAAALSACSPKQEANESLPSSSAGPSKPELPPLGPADFPVPKEARQKTPEGAVEFVRYYMSLPEHLARTTLDPQALLDLSQDCQTCTMIAESLSRDRAAGYRYRVSMSEFRPYGHGRIMGDQAEVGFVYSQGEVAVVDSTGQIVKERSTPATGDLQSGASVMWRNDLRSWVISSLTVG